MTKKPIAVVCADTHLQQTAWSSSGIDGDSYFSLAQIFDVAIEREIDVIGCGDLIDKKRNSSEPILQWYSQLDRLQRTGAGRLFYIQGQHEMQAMPWLSKHKCSVHVGDLSPFSIDGVDFLGLDWQSGPRLEKHLENEFPCDVMLMHQVWGNLMGSITIPEGNFESVLGPKLVITGDYHKEYVDMELVNNDGKLLRVINPGSTCMQSIDEPPQKYCFILFDDLSTERLELLTRPHRRFPLIVGEEDLEQVMVDARAWSEEIMETRTDLPESIRKPLLWIHYSVEVREVKQRLSSVVEDSGFLFFKPYPRDRVDVEIMDVQGEATLESMLGGYLSQADLAYAEKDASRLLLSQEPLRELGAMLEEFEDKHKGESDVH